MSKDGDDPTPGPEEMAKKLSEFLRGQFESNGFPSSFAGFPGFEDPDGGEAADESSPQSESPKDKDLFQFDLHPKDIKTHLDRFVIRQDDAKKALSIAVCDHYNHARYLHELSLRDPEKARSIEFSKQNVILMGSTGVGKTYLVKHVAELIGVPFVKADATKFSETGYVGADVDDLVRELVAKADGDIELAEHGIIYVDEIDKLATSAGMIGRDVSGRGVQTTLLKLMEETEVPIRNPMDMQGQMQSLLDLGRGDGAKSKDVVNTRHVLFIVSGAFSGLGEIIASRTGENAIGFASSESSPTAGDQSTLDSGLLEQLRTEDLIKHGFEAEFVGRLPVRVLCEDLDADALHEIMVNSEGSLLHQYRREFEAYGISIRFEDSGLREIAKLAAREKTGARGLMTVCERALRLFKFELPGSFSGEIVVTGELIRDPARSLAEYQKTAADPRLAEIGAAAKSYAQNFRKKHGITLRFVPEGITALAAISDETAVSTAKILEEQFQDFPFALRLVEKNTGRSTFKIDGQAIEDPEAFLSNLVIDTYRGTDQTD